MGYITQLSCPCGLSKAKGIELFKLMNPTPESSHRVFAEFS